MNIPFQILWYLRVVVILSSQKERLTPNKHKSVQLESSPRHHKFSIFKFFAEDTDSFSLSLRQVILYLLKRRRRITPRTWEISPCRPI
jgi:hypothetical protein